MRRRSSLLLLGFAGLLGLSLAAQVPKPETIVQLQASPARFDLKRGSTATVVLAATILKGFHINSNKPTEEYLIPTRVELPEGSPLVLVEAGFPVGELKSFGFAPEDKLSVYEGTVKVSLKLQAKPDAKPGLETLRLAFHYQACNDQLCLRPARREITLSVRIQ